MPALGVPVKRRLEDCPPLSAPGRPRVQQKMRAQQAQQPSAAVYAQLLGNAAHVADRLGSAPAHKQIGGDTAKGKPANPPTAAAFQVRTLEQIKGDRTTQQGAARAAVAPSPTAAAGAAAVGGARAKAAEQGARNARPLDGAGQGKQAASPTAPAPDEDEELLAGVDVGGAAAAKYSAEAFDAEIESLLEAA